MSLLRIERVNALPGTLTANTMYLVKSATAGLADVYLVGSTVAEVRHIISKAEIDTLISTAVTNFNNIEVVADITARNALGATLTRNALVLVADATGDATVTSGAALYIFNSGDDSWTKVSEFESLDVVLSWANIQDKPVSSVADIDSAVTQRHSHSNKTELDKVGEADGAFTYNGANPEAGIAVTEW